MKPRIRLLALDIDGTLIGEDLLLRERTVAAVRAAVDHGVSVSLCTGRMASSALQFAHQLGLTEPLVAYQGALIREMPPRGSTRPGRIRVHTPLRADVAREVVAWAIERGLDPHVNHLERFIIAADDRRLEQVMRSNVVTIDPLEPAVAAAQRVADHGLAALPVVSRDQRVLGAVTLDAALTQLAPAWRTEVPRVFT